MARNSGGSPVMVEGMPPAWEGNGKRFGKMFIVVGIGVLAIISVLAVSLVLRGPQPDNGGTGPPPDNGGVGPQPDNGGTEPQPDNGGVGPQQNQPPVASFSFSPPIVSTNDVVQFTDTSIDSDGFVVSWSWDFDDGASSTERNPTHQYAVSGNYTVNLTVTDNGGATDDFSQIINVESSVWTLVWSDEFNGSSVDTSNWIFETGGGGWGNNELEYYTNGANASVNDGILTITAKKESMGGYSYTSTRIKTKGMHEFQYRKIEARIAVPMGQGLWPAFWMLGSNIGSVGWPKCGEIDIMEHVNTETTIHGTMHWDYNGHVSYGDSVNNSSPELYHTYTIEWDSSSIRWYQDGVQYHEANIQNNVNSTEEFHQPFFIILNLAVGGNWPGSPSPSTTFPATYKIDYVRVFKPYFTVSVSPVSATVPPGGSVQANVQVSVQDNYTQIVSLSASGQPSGVTVNFSPSSGTHSFSSTMTIDVGETAAEGSYKITITGTGADGKTYTCNYSLVISAAGVQPYVVFNDSGIPPGEGEVWTWHGGSGTFDSGYTGESPPEGTKCFRTYSANWAGWGVFLIYPSHHTVDLSSYSSLKFWVKTPADLKVEIEAPEGTKHTRYISAYGWDGTNNWQEITIPASAFANLNQVWAPFLATIGTGGTFYIDNVRWV